MIKNVIFIIFFSIFLLGCSNKNERALEKCSDNIFMQSYAEDILKKDFTYQSLEKNREELSKASKKYFSELDRYKQIKGYNSDQNLRKLTKKWRRDETDKNWKELKNYQKEIGYADDEERKRLTDIWYASTKKLDKKYRELKEYKEVKSKEIFSTMKFDDKISIDNYYKIYQQCEIELKKTPTAFLKKWS